MKKLSLIILLLSISGIVKCHKHQIFLSEKFRSYNGTYEFNLEAYGYRTKSWRVKVADGKPTILLEGAIHINPSTEIRVSHDGSDIYVDGKGWCMDNFFIKVLEGKLGPEKVGSKQIAVLKRCKDHRFDVDVKQNKITIETKY